MGYTLPTKPDIGNVNTKDQKALLEYQQQLQEYWFAVNAIQQAQNRESEARSNIEEANDRAVHSMIENLK